MMNRSKSNFLRSGISAFSIFVFAVGNCAAQTATAPAAGSFKLQDFLGRTWQRERVSFPLSGAALQSADKGQALIAPDGKAVPYQISASENGATKIEFIADLNAFETRTYRFGSTPAGSTPGAMATDLKIEDSADAIRISNSQTGIAIRKKLENGAGPIASIKLASGKWIGDSHLDSKQAPLEYSTQVVARGPVYSEVICRANFGEGKAWQMRFRLQANEPVIDVDESFSLKDDSAMRLSFSQNFAPDNVLYRYGKGMPTGQVGTLATHKIAAGEPEPAFMLVPWLPWWEREREGTWFGIYNEGGSDLLSIGARDAGDWVQPAKTEMNPLGVTRVAAEPQSSPQLALTQSDAELKLSMPLLNGRRKWMIAALDKTASLEFANSKTWNKAPLPQQVFIKHGDFPLDAVKDYVFAWGGAEKDSHPRLFLKKDEVAKLRKTFKADPAKLAAYTTAPIYGELLDGPLSYYLGTGDEALGKHLAEACVQQMQATVDLYLQEGEKVTLGFAPHNNTAIIPAMNLADVVLGSGLLALEAEERLRAQIAFLGYTVNRDDFWSVERGFGGNPNMTTLVAAYQTSIGATIPSHPMAKTWMTRGLAEFKHQMNTWSDENGGWLEAPHYAMAAYDLILGCFIMARNAGLGDDVYNPKMKKIGAWFANISTPRDSRLSNFRHIPPLGNSYMREPTSEFGTLAYLWKERDPKFASEMQWMHEQQGAPSTPGVGGFFPIMAGYRTIFLDMAIPAKAPAYESELYPETGVVLRSAYNTDRENYLHMIAGNNHAHYDKDSGSVTLWGKGRLISDDFGYYGYVTGEDHSMVMSAVALDDPIMHAQKFAKGRNLDYVSGTKPGWTRQIAHVKSADPLAPNYFVLRDTTRTETTSPAIWRMWLTAAKVTPNGNQATVEGTEDVDTDIFFAGPGEIKLSTEEKTRSTYGILNGNYQLVPTTQTGLIAVASSGPGFMAIVYPRHKSEKPPTFTSLADGKVVKVESSAGTDYVFLSSAPFAWKEGDISFLGTVGSIQIRGGQAVLSLGADGRIAANGKDLKQGETPVVAAANAKVNLPENGDFESGAQDIFTAGEPAEKLTIAIQKGNTAAGGAARGGEYSAALNLQGGEKNAAYTSVKKAILVNPNKTYRVSLKAFSSAEISATIGGYANKVGGGAPLTNEKGEVWQYAVTFAGPSEGWQNLETTVGPKGSNAKFQWPAETAIIGMNIWLNGPPGVLHVDDIAIEEVVGK